MSMTATQAEKDFGKVSYEDDDFIVRVKRVGDEVMVHTHSKVGGIERLPNGYMLGSNCLIYKKR